MGLENLSSGDKPSLREISQLGFSVPRMAAVIYGPQEKEKRGPGRFSRTEEEARPLVQFRTLQERLIPVLKKIVWASRKMSVPSPPSHSQSGAHILRVAALFLFVLSLCFGEGGESVGSMFWTQSAFLALGTFSFFVLSKKKPQFAVPSLLLPIGAFLVVAFFGYLVSPYRFSTELELVWFLSCLCALAWLIFCTSERTKADLMKVCIYSTMIQAAYFLVQFYFLGTTRAKGTFASPNHAATYIACGVAFCFTLFSVGSLSFPRKVWWGTLGGLGLWALMTTGSRSVFFSLGIALVLCVVLFGLSKKYLFALSIIIAIFLLVPSPIRDRILFSGVKDIYAIQRPMIWLHSAKIILDFPLLGATLGNFEHVSSRYQFPVEHGVGRYTKTFVTADNGFLELGAETGVPGIICMAWGVFIILRELRNGAREVEDENRKLIFLGAGAVILVLLSQNLFHKVYRSPPNVWMGMVALSIVSGAKSSREASQRIKNPPSPDPGDDRRVRALIFRGIAIVIALGVWPFMCLSPYLAFANYERAAILQGEGRLEEAEEKLQKAISLNRGQAFFFRRMGDIQMERFSKQPSPLLAKSALENFERAVELNRINPALWHTLARYHEFMVSFSQGQEREAHIGEAAVAYKKAIELAPTNPFYRVSLAALFIKAGRIEDAEGPLEEALRLEPNFITARVLLIDLKEKLGRKDEAEAHKAGLEETVKRVSRLKPMNQYEARLLMDPGTYFKD